MDSAFWVVVIGALVTVCISGGLPIYLQKQKNENDAKVTNAANTRADLIAARAEEVVAKAEMVRRDLLANNTKTAALAAAQAELINDKVDSVHKLVNSSMTVVKQAFLKSLKSERGALLENIEMRKSQGEQPTVDTLAAIRSLDETVSNLEADISDRLRLQAATV